MKPFSCNRRLLSFLLSAMLGLNLALSAQAAQFAINVDLLATLRVDARPTLLDWADMQEKLAELFGRPVDLVSRRAIERSRNRYRKHFILCTALPIYAEG